MALTATSCDSSSSVSEQQTLKAGTIGLTLTLPGVVVETVRFEVTGNGLVRSGDISVASDGATASVLVGGIPAGTGYTLRLTASTIDGKTTCAGSNMADVSANATTSVFIDLQCRTETNLGAVMGTGRFSFCPNVTSLSAAPGAGMSTGTGAYEETLDLVAVAVDLDGQPLTFEWSANSGSFVDPNGASTVYRCAAPGPVTVTLTVSDGGCQQAVIATLVCLPFCTNKLDGTTCNDEDACTRADRCRGGACLGGDPVICEAADQCHVPGACNRSTGACSNPAASDGRSCDDRNLCTAADSCRSGRCVGGAALVCVAPAQCQVAGTCEPSSGACGFFAAADFTSCQLPAATAACMGGACQISSCAGGVGDCNRVAADGCETPLNTSTNCGTCGHACGVGTSCVAGLCLSQPPSGVAAVAGGWKNVLTWMASAGATRYEVLRGPATTGPFQGIGTTTGTRLIDTTVRSGVTYFYVVRAVNAEGSSGNSLPASATTLTKQLCVTDNLRHAVTVFDTSQSGSTAAPLRVLGGTTGSLRFPTDVASSPTSNELFVVRRGGQIDAFPLSAAGAATPSRTFLTAVPGGFAFGLTIDELTGELFTVDYVPGARGGRVMAMDPLTGAPTRLITGDNTQLGRPVGLIVDGAHGEVLVGIIRSTDAVADFPRVQAYDIAQIAGGGGNLPPKRVLGGPGSTTVGGAAIAYDRSRDQIFTSCDCDNRLSVFPRSALGDAAPVRTLELPPSVAGISAFLMDEAADTVWVVARGSGGTATLLEISRGGNGSVPSLSPGIDLAAPGRIGACN